MALRKSEVQAGFASGIFQAWLVLLGVVVTGLGSPWTFVVTAGVLVLSVVYKILSLQSARTEATQGAAVEAFQRVVSSGAQMREPSQALRTTLQRFHPGWDNSCKKIGFPPNLAGAVLKRWKDSSPNLGDDDKVVLKIARDFYQQQVRRGVEEGERLETARRAITGIVDGWVNLESGEVAQGSEKYIRTYRTIIVMNAYLEIAWLKTLTTRTQRRQGLGRISERLPPSL